MRHDAQFDLRIVSADQFAAGCRDECFANFAAFFGSNRNILKIRIRGRQTSCHSDRLFEGRVDSSVFGIDHLRKFFRISRHEFCDRAVLQGDLCQGIIFSQFRKNFFAGGIIPRDRLFRFRTLENNTHLVEQNLAKLFRAGQLEIFPGNFKGLLFQFSGFRI